MMVPRASELPQNGAISEEIRQRDREGRCLGNESGHSAFRWCARRVDPRRARTLSTDAPLIDRNDKRTERLLIALVALDICG
jgi:hypothetical protein